MPTYEYQCRQCGYKFEVFQKITEEPLKTCPKCPGAVQRLIGSGGGIIFKGAGFYATEYRSQEYKDRQKQEISAGDNICPASADNKACKQCPLSKNGK